MFSAAQTAAPTLALHGQGWREIGELLLAFALSTVIGLEREARQKNAGVRTHTLVGVGAALFTIVSKHGFSDVLWAQHIVLDPSRVAAQIVTGIGFIGGGLIFVRRDAVRGLTTAAIVWVTAAVGMACGAGLPLLALVVTGLHLVIVFVFPPVLARIGYQRVAEVTQVRLSYSPAAGVLPQVLELCTKRGFHVLELEIEHAPWAVAGRGDLRERDEQTAVRANDTIVVMRLRGIAEPQSLASALAGIPGVHAVTVGELTSGE